MAPPSTVPQLRLRPIGTEQLSMISPRGLASKLLPKGISQRKCTTTNFQTTVQLVVFLCRGSAPGFRRFVWARGGRSRINEIGSSCAIQHAASLSHQSKRRRTTRTVAFASPTTIRRSALLSRRWGSCGPRRRRIRSLPRSFGPAWPRVATRRSFLCFVCSSPGCDSAKPDPCLQVACGCAIVWHVVLMQVPPREPDVFRGAAHQHFPVWPVWRTSDRTALQVAPDKFLGACLGHILLRACGFGSRPRDTSPCPRESGIPWLAAHILQRLFRDRYSRRLRSQLSETETDCFLYVLTQIGPDTKTAELGCSLKGQVRDQFRARLGTVIAHDVGNLILQLR